MTESQHEPSSPPGSVTLLPPSASVQSPSAPPHDSHHRRRFDPSRSIGIIKRKALIKDLAAVYQAECIAYCKELLEFQRKCEEPNADIKVAAESRKETMRPTQRHKRSH